MVTQEERHQLNIFPFYLEGAERVLAFRRCEVFPGVVVKYCGDGKLGKLQPYWESHPSSKFLTPNMMISVETKKYSPYIIAETKRGGFDTDRMLRNWGTLGANLLSTYKVHRHLLTCMFILKRCNVWYPTEGIHIQVEPDGRRGSWSYSNAPSIRQFPDASFSRATRFEKASITSKDLREIAKITEIYYRPTIWLSDRVSFALGTLWAFLSDPARELGFVSLVTLLEALLGTGGGELTHQISERVAVTIGGDATKKTDSYRRMKKLYNDRSRFVHGSVTPKKGQGGWGASFVSAQHSNVDVTVYADLVDVSMNVLYRLLRNPDFLTLVQQRKTEEVINGYVADYFLSRLFS